MLQFERGGAPHPGPLPASGAREKVDIPLPAFSGEREGPA
jgi:hypothetical protein